MSTYLIIGANRGIGFELAQQLASRGERVLAACRVASDELKALDVEVIEGVEVTRESSVREMADAIEGPVDVLVHVAGVLKGDDLDSLELNDVRIHFEVNTLGPLSVVRTLKSKLASGGKVFILSSRVGSMADNGSGGNYGYRISKAAVNMVGVNLSHDLKPLGVSCILLHPGYVRTDMTQGNGNVEAAEAASGLIDRLDELGMEETGTFWHANGERLPW